MNHQTHRTYHQQWIPVWQLINVLRVGYIPLDPDSKRHRLLTSLSENIKHTYIHIYIYTSLHLYIYTYIHIYTYTYIYIHIYTYTYIYTYIYTHIYSDILLFIGESVGGVADATNIYTHSLSFLLSLSFFILIDIIIIFIMSYNDNRYY